MKDVRSVQVIVKELGKRPKACSLDVPYGAAHDDLKSAVSNVVLGPEDERWTKVHEQTKEDLDPQHGGGTIHVTTKYEAQELQLWTHPHDDCCPMQRVELKNLPPELDVYALLAGPAALNPSPLDDGPALRAWWVNLPRGRHALRSCAERRLAAKACVPAVAVLPVLRRKPKDPSTASATATANQEDSNALAGEGGESTQHPNASQQGGGGLGQQPESSTKDVASEAVGAKDGGAGSGAKSEEKGSKVARPSSPKKAAAAAAAAAAGKAPQEGQGVVEGEAEGEGVEEAKQTHLEVGPIQREEDEAEAVMVEMEVPWNLRHDLMLESMQGLWEMATRDRPYPLSFSHDTLAVLVHGLESGALEVMSIAAAAVWVVAAKADQRSALVQLGAVEALAGAALIGHTEREHLCRTKQDAALVEAEHKNEAATAAQAVADKAEEDAQKAIKWAAKGIGGAAAEVAKDEAIAKAAAAKAEAAVVRAEADAAADHAAAMARDAAAAEIDGAEGVEGEFKEGCNEVNGVEWNEEKRALLLLCNRVVYHCLGALGIMAVDQKARAMALQVSPNLNFLTHLAVAEFPPPPSLAPPLHPAKPETSSEQEEAEDTQSQEPAPPASTESTKAARTTDKKEDQAPAVPSSKPTSKEQEAARDKDDIAGSGKPAVEEGQPHDAEKEEGQAQEHEGDLQANAGERQSVVTDDAECGGEGPPGELMPEDDVLVQQKMAVEVLYAMLGRDRDVRASLAQNGGLKDLLELTRASSGDVRSVALLCLNAYARDASPPTHTTGHDMLARSGQALALVHGLLGALDDLLDMHRMYPPEEHALGLEQHPLLVVVETAASALWGAVAAQVSAERLSWEPNTSESDPSASRRSSGSESLFQQFTYDDTSLLARAAGRLVVLLQEMESRQQEEGNEADGLNPDKSWTRENLDLPHALISNEPFGGQYGSRSSASCTAVSLYCIMASLATVHGTPVLTARAHAHVTSLHIDLQQLQAGTGVAKETLDNHVAQMISKRTASKFFIDDDDDAHHAKQLEEALLAAHEDVHNMQKRIEEVEEALQGGCEECLAAAQDTLRLRLHLVQPSKGGKAAASSAEGALASGGSEESPMSDHSQGYLSEDDAEGMGRRVSTRDDGNDLMGMVHLAAAAMVTALAQTAHPALKPTAVDPSPLFLGPFRALLRCNGVLKDLIALVMSCDTCTGGPIQRAPSFSTAKHSHRASSACADLEGIGQQEDGGNPSQGPEAGAAAHGARTESRPASALQHGRGNDARAESRPASALQHGRGNDARAESRPASALQHGRGSRAPSRRPSAGSLHSVGSRAPSSAQPSHRSDASDVPSMAGLQSRAEAAHTATKAGSKDAGTGDNAKVSAGEYTLPPFGVPPPINDPPPLTPVAIATRLVVAAGVVHLLASDEPVGQHQLWQLLAYMQHQSATANAGATLLSDLIAQAEHEMNEEELMAANQGHHDSDAETDTSYSRTAMAHSEAVQGLRSLHAALAGCEALPPFMAACMWCLCRHQNGRKGLLVGDSEAWITLIEGWLGPGLVAVNQHHCIIHPGPDGFYTRPPQAAKPSAAQHTGEAGLKGQSKGAGNSGSEDERIAAEEGRQMFASLGRRSQWGGSSASSSSKMDAGPGMDGPAHTEKPLGGATNQQGFEPGGFAPFGLGSLAFAAARPSRSAAAASRQVRNSIMSLWLLLRQWLTDNLSPMNLLRSCNGLFVVGGPSWWQLPLSINTPLPLTSAVSRGMHAMMEAATALPDTRGSDGGALREMTMRCCWNLSVSHPAVEERFVSLGNALLALATATSPTACSSLRVVAINYIMSLTSTPAHVEAMGGLVQVAGVLAMMVDNALSSADAAGRGADLPVLEAATRGLARLGLSSKGRHALKRCKCIRRLVQVAHADNMALEEVAGRRMEAGVPGWESPAELVAPLRAINDAMPTAPTAAQQHVEIALQDAAHDVRSTWGAEVGGLGWEGTQLLPFEQPALPAETQRSAAEVAAAALAAASTGPGSSMGEGTEEASRSSHDGAQGQGLVQMHGNLCSSSHAHGSKEHEVGGDADIGLMSLWGLLNLSNYEPAQVSICRHGLYTLLRMVHRSMDPRRRSTAAAILTNIHFHPGNATTLYKAEIKLKFAALLRLRGLNQEARKAKLQKLPFQIEPDSLKAKSIAQSIASKSSPQKRAEQEGADARSTNTARRSSTRERMTKGARALATSQIEKGLKQMQASIAKDETPQEDQQMPQSPFLMGGQDAAESESGSAVEDPAALEAKLAFLRWVVEPGMHVLGDQPAPEELSAGDLAGGAGITTADLMSRLTNDPEEEAWLAYIGSVAAMDDFEHTRHMQGDYLRGSLSRSLAEGAQSLWQSRAARAPASPSASSPRASLLPTRPATANLLRSSRAAPAGAMHGSNSPLNAADPEVEVLEAKPSPNAATSARKKSSAKQGSTQGSNGPRSRTQTSNAKPMRSSSGRAKREEGSGGGKGEGVGVDEGTGGNSASAGQTHGGAADGGASLSGNKKHGNATRAKGKSSSTVPRARPSTAPPKQAWKRGTAGEPLRPAAASLPMWSPHIKSFIQDKAGNKAGNRPNVLAERLLHASIPEATTGYLASLADDILENKTVKEGRRAAEEAVAAEAAARKAAEEEAEAERLREAGIAEELQVIDLTRFDSFRSVSRRRSSMNRSARFSSFGVAQGASSECSDHEGAQSKPRLSRSMSRALSVAVVRASQRGEARAADRAAEYAAKAADAAAAARLPARKMARRGSSKRNMPNGSTSTRQTRTSIDFATTRQPSFASSVSEAGWPKGSVANLSGGAASKEEGDDASVSDFPTVFANQEGSRPLSAMKKATLVAPGPGDEKEATQEDVAAKPQVRLHRETTVRFGDGGSSSDDLDIPPLQNQGMQQQGAQFGVFTGEGGQAGAIGQRLSNTEIAAQKAVAALESKASPRPKHAAPTRGSPSFVASSLVQIGTLSSMPSMSPRAAANQGRSSSLRVGTAKAQHIPGFQTQQQQQQQPWQQGLVLGVDATVPEGTEGGEEEPEDQLGPHVRAALQGPVGAPYHIPYVGSTRPAGQTLSSLKRDLHYEAWEAVAFPARAAARAKYLANRSTLAHHVPKPVTMLSVDASDLTALKHAEQQLKAMVTSDGDSVPKFDYQQVEKEARELREKVQGELPLRVKLATGDGGPDRVYHFDHQLGYDPRHLVMFEHVEGATFCESLYGHYLLPNGKLAHFALGDTVRKGHKVDLVAPPAIPFSALDWLHAPGGPLPTTKAFAEWSLPGTRRSTCVLAPLWCPIPALGPAAPTTMEGGIPMLQWKDLSSPVQGHEAMAAAEGEKAPMLALRSVCIAATLHRITRITQETTTVLPKPKVVHKKKKKPTTGRSSPVRR